MKTIWWIGADVALVVCLVTIPSPENGVVARERIAAPVHQVWELLADFEVVPQPDGRLSAARVLTVPHRGPGTIRHYQMNGRDLFEMVTDWTVEERLSLLVVHWPRRTTERATFYLVPSAEGTEVVLAVSYKPGWGLLGGAVDRLRSQNEHHRRAQDCLANLKASLDTQGQRRGHPQRPSPQAA